VIEDYLRQRMNRMKNPEDKAFMRELLETALLPLCAETERRYNELAERVRRETAAEDRWITAHTVLERGEVLSHPYLRPLVPDEAAERPTANRFAITVFYEGDALKIRRLRADKPYYAGTARGNVNMTFRLMPCDRYNRLAAQIYRLFLQNDVSWQTLPLIYLDKFFDLVPLEDPPAGVTQADISLDLGDERFRTGMIPVWNIDKVRLRGSEFPQAALDKVNYEFRFDLSKHGLEHSYLVDAPSGSVSALRREESELVAVTPEQKLPDLSVYRVLNIAPGSADSFRYPLVTNGYEAQFAARLQAQSGTAIKSQLELTRFLRSFSMSKGLELDSFAVTNDAAPGETYALDGFIEDEIRDRGVKKTLLLRFRAEQRDYFLNRDIMSFLAARTQLLFPEFSVRGVLV
jgi:hypothetical protein